MVEVKTAVRLGIERVQRAAVNGHSNEDCLSCHHHTLPRLASMEGLRVGLPVDSEWMKAQAGTTHAYFEQHCCSKDVLIVTVTGEYGSNEFVPV